jgi:aminoglycoside phosphotransferase family enzyme/predicted kinase
VTDRAPALVADLCRPASYPVPQPGRVELVATHISWVFLTSDHAWKVRRPVKLPFLDFSTVERRKHDCEEEIRLNRRLAPGVYQTVVPVLLGPGGHTFVGPGTVVDHAVKMRRLPEERSAAALLRAGELTAARLARLAKRLAEFYRTVGPPAGLSGADSFARTVEENLEELAEFSGRFLDPARLRSVAAAQRRDLAAHARLLAARAASGRFREGHGDLRLEHVYFEGEAGDEEPLVIDCVEFNPAFRCGDVALDVAFLAMELEAAGRPDLSDHFLYRFARDSSDYDFYPLIDLYLCHRALVRAKVACLLAADATTPALKAARKQEEAGRLLALAQAHAAGSPARRPVLVSVGGLVGAGKSTLAEALSLRLGFPVISSDLTRKSLGGVQPLERGPPSLYSDELTTRTYAEMLRRAGCVLRSGRGVILDGTFRTAATRAQARAAAAAHGAPFQFIEATCDEATLRERLRARRAGGTESDADDSVLDRIRHEHQPADELPASERLIADTTREPQALAADLEARLPAPPPR